MLVIGTQNNEQHPVLKIGDIVVEYNKQAIRNNDHYSSLASNSVINEVKILRFVADCAPQYLTKTILTDCKVLIGILNLTENE